jgi:hypothetical protein
MVLILCCISSNRKIRYRLHAICILFADNRPSISNVYDNNYLLSIKYTLKVSILFHHITDPVPFFCFGLVVQFGERHC